MKNWEVKKLKEVCKIGDGNHSSNYPKSNEMVSKGIPFIRANNMINGNVSWNEMKFITKEKHDILKKGHLKTGDILFTNRGEIGKIAILGSDFENANLNSQIAWFRSLKEINNKFLFYFLLSPEMLNYYLVEKNGAALQQFTIRQINDINIPLPPLSEQKRIVAILDEAFVAIDKAKANTEKNLQNAKELFESYLQNVFENKGEDWEEKALGEIADVEYGYTDKSKEAGDFRYIRITDIDSNGELILTEKKYIKGSKEAKGFIVENDDLLMARTGATFAKVLLYKEYEPSVFASYLIRIRFKEKIENELYWHFTKTKGYWEQANALSSGAAQPHFNGAALKQVVFPYPKKIEEQKKLIKKFQTLSAETKKLETIYQQKLNDLEELKKSVLQKAFSGELSER